MHFGVKWQKKLTIKCQKVQYIILNHTCIFLTNHLILFDLKHTENCYLKSKIKDFIFVPIYPASLVPDH